MKYVIISDAGSPHVFNFINTSIIDRGYDIYIVTHSVGAVPEKYRQFYKANNIKVYSLKELGYDNLTDQNIFNRLRKLYIKFSFLRKIGKIDICHIKYVHRTSVLMYLTSRRNIKNLIVSFWGTDILCSTEKSRKWQKKLFKYADLITLTSKKTYNFFVNNYGKEWQDKAKIVRYSAGAVDQIKEFSKTVTKEECREEFNVPNGKYMVVVGYNADPSQHQDIIFNKLSVIPQEYKDKIHMIIPLQYARISDKYINEVKLAAQNSGISFEALEEFVPFEKNAKMSLATDIYIHMRDSDAFSMAMKEIMYAGAVMIQGSWLSYPEFDEDGAPIVKVDSFDELPDAFTKLMDNFVYKDKFKLYDFVYEISSKEFSKKGWATQLDLIEKNVNN